MQHTDSRGRRHVAVGRPGVEGPQTGQHAEPEGEHREHPQLHGAGKGAGLLQLHQFVDIEGWRAGPGRGNIGGQYANPDQHAAAHQHQHQLHGAVLFRPQEQREIGAAAPNPHQQIHRQYRQFVEEKQEEQVAHDEDAINSGAQCQQQNEKVTGAPHNRLADQHGAHQNDAIQQHQRCADAIQPKVQADVDGVTNPGVFPRELDSAHAVVIPDEDGDG